ncbi:MAG TPA: hypothetical protein VNT52_17280 [Acidimicrobiales bacterium]|nr:hypothetical protein [Acidimicrobiales bacterium]
MKPTHYIRAADGALVTEGEALDARGVIKPGYGFKSLLLMRDHAAPGAPSSQVAYERRISDAWKGPEQRTAAQVNDAAHARAKQRGSSVSQAAYELRVSDAWKTPSPRLAN